MRVEGLRLHFLHAGDKLLDANSCFATLHMLFPVLHALPSLGSLSPRCVRSELNLNSLTGLLCSFVFPSHPRHDELLKGRSQLRIFSAALGTCKGFLNK